MTLARKWMTLGQAAEVTGRSERTIQRWVADARLKSVELEGTRYVNELALLHVERDTRRTHHGARPGSHGALLIPRLDTDVVSSGHSGQQYGPDRDPR